LLDWLLAQLSNFQTAEQRSRDDSAEVSSIGEHRLLATVQQLAHLRHIGHIGRGHHHAMHPPGSLVHVDGRLHAEVPQTAFPGLPYLRITRLVTVLGRRGCKEQPFVARIAP